MSSHHVVRDEQEPALLILKPHVVPVEILNGLLEWSPVVVVSEYAVLWLQDLGVKIDAIISKDKKADQLMEMLDQGDFEIMESPKGDIIQNALEYLKSRNIVAAGIIDEPDEVFLTELARTNFKWVVYFDRLKWFHVKDSFRKWVKSSQLYRSYQKSEVWLNQKAIDWNQHSSHYQITTEQEGFLEFKTNGNSFWLGEQIQA